MHVQRLGTEQLLQSPATLEEGGVRARDERGCLFFDIGALTAALQTRCYPMYHVSHV